MKTRIQKHFFGTRVIMILWVTIGLFTFNLGAAQTITPNSWIAGTEVTITGTNFDAVLADNEVSFGGIATTITAASATQPADTIPQELTGPFELQVTANGTDPLYRMVESNGMLPLGINKLYLHRALLHALLRDEPESK